MCSFEQHCYESICMFGEPFKEVYLWLDEFFDTPKYGVCHRRVRHHEAGIQEAIRIFGEKASQAARQHIISDLREEGWTDNDPFPKDEQDYVRMGFF